MLIQWKEINSPDELPRDEKSFLAIWKGRICIAQYDEDKNCFFISFDPSDIVHSWEIAKDRERKFTHICILTPDAYPEDLR